MSPGCFFVGATPRWVMVLRIVVTIAYAVTAVFLLGVFISLSGECPDSTMAIGRTCMAQKHTANRVFIGLEMAGYLGLMFWLSRRRPRN